MHNLLTYLLNLFGLHDIIAEDHLTGTIDLSDAQYCMGLLDRNIDA